MDDCFILFIQNECYEKRQNLCKKHFAISFTFLNLLQTNISLESYCVIDKKIFEQNTQIFLFFIIKTYDLSLSLIPGPIVLETETFLMY